MIILKLFGSRFWKHKNMPATAGAVAGLARYLQTVSQPLATNGDGWLASGRPSIALAGCGRLRSLLDFFVSIDIPQHFRTSSLLKFYPHNFEKLKIKNLLTDFIFFIVESLYSPSLSLLVLDHLSNYIINSFTVSNVQKF